MNSPAPTRSAFVTVIGWVFLVLSVGSLLIGLLQALVMHTIFPPGMFDQLARQSPAPPMPPVFAWVFDNMAWLMVAGIVQSAVKATASAGLLLRRNWARLLFIALKVLAIITTIGSTVFQILMFQAMREQFPSHPAGGPGHFPDFGPMFVGMGVFAGAIALAFCGLYVWIILKLRSPAIVAEFRR